ncbi:MAG: DNA translocase FtsK 4TM domain-containing protein [Eubacterium sp.]|nr:DNA translocase FtsK 4TM domain-containing protein [Eubacterium sp.]
MANSKKAASKSSGSKKTTGNSNSKKGKKKTVEETPEQIAAREEIRQMQEKRRQNHLLYDMIWGLVCIAVGAFIFIAVKFQAAGEFGNALGEVLRGIFGLIGLVVPWYLILVGILLVIHKVSHFNAKKIVVCILLLLMVCILNSARFIDEANLVYAFKAFYQDGTSLIGGGLFGMTLGVFLITLFGRSGLYIFTIAAILICLLLLFNTPLTTAYENFVNKREEKRLMKEKTFQEVQQLQDPSQPIYNEQLSVEDVYTPPSKAAGSRPADKIRSYKRASKRTHPEGELDLSLPSDEIQIITPFTQMGLGGSSGAAETGKSNVLDFMSADDPFQGKRGGSTSVGLEESSAPRSGFGLDGAPEEVKKPAKKKKAASKNLDTSAYEPEKISKHEIAQGAAEIGADLGLVGGAAALTKSVDQSVVHRYEKPPIDLLNMPVAPDGNGVSDDLKKRARLLEDTLQSFNVDAKVIAVTQGPAVTRYEIQPNVGVKVSKISSLANDIALNLRARSIRIEAPIPGKAAVGIEVENDKINMVTIREIIDSKEFRNAKSKIEFAVGKDIAGKPIVADLKSMPHMLIAGSTGSGKSVCINSIITSILYKADPDEVKLVLIDPKVVELGNYNGIPHLLIPVVTEPSKAAAALSWAVVEMTNRYKMFAEANVRDLSSYNKKMRSERKADMVIPQVVIIIDELADLMMAAPSQVEESICRLAQMARAAGMHLIVATQRPSVDVITGVIKANIPSRIAFAVSSQFDSRTILDMSGAEKLMGKGDMLFNPLGMGKPVRVQGTFISDEEVERVIDYVKSQVAEAEYSNDVMESIEKGGNADTAGGDDADELLPDAIECVVMQGQASVSMLQRRFRIGYNRAARIVDQMEARGIVGPQDGSRPRQVLMTEEELEQLKQDTQGM